MANRNSSNLNVTINSDGYQQGGGNTERTFNLSAGDFRVVAGTNATITFPTTSGTLYATNNNDVAVADGGTGASTAAGARANLLNMWTADFTCSTTAAPADSTTYYFGFPYDVSFNTTSPTLRQKIMPFAGVLRGAGINVVATAGGSTEGSTLQAVINNTTAVSLSASLLTMDQGNQWFATTGLSQTISANDKIEMRLITPAWATNPTNVRILVTLYIE